MEFEYELGEVERAVLNLAEKMANMTQKIEYEALFFKASRELHYSKIEVSNAINILYLKKHIRVGSRLTRGRVLENPTREKIYEYIVTHIGAHVREMGDKLSITPHLLYWHLTMLENFEYIYRVKFSKYVNFFPSNFSETYVFPFLVLKNKNALRIFRTILKNPLIDFEALQDGLNLQKSVISYHLDNLKKHELVFTKIINEITLYGINYDKIAPIKTFYNISDEKIKHSSNMQNKKGQRINLKVRKD